MADPNRLTYTRGGMEKLRQAYERMSREELLDLVCHMQKTYVLDQTIPFDIPIPEREEEQEKIDAPGSERAVEDPNDTPIRRFARLIEGLKRRTSLPQLQGFSTTEDGKAVLVIDNQRVTFGERVTIEFVPMRQAAAAAAAAAPPPERPRPGAPQESPEGRSEDEARDEVSRAPSPGAGAPFAAPSAPARAGAGRPTAGPPPARLVPPPAPRGPMPAAAARRGAPGAPSKPAPAPQKPPAPEPSSAPPSDESGAERFRGLELD